MSDQEYMSDHELPSFDRPPVVETVLGVQFQAIPGFSNAHLGAFWHAMEGDWPTVTDASALNPVHELFGKDAVWSTLRASFTLTSDPSARLQIKNAAGDAMVQIQNGRLHFNWLGQKGREYPRYESVRPRFDSVLNQFRAFLANHNLGELSPDQWEITYVNHMPQGTVWSDPADWPKLFPGLPGVWTLPSCVRMETFGGAWHYEIEPQRGRLHVEVSCVRAGSPQGPQTLRLMLTARGPASDERAVGDGLSLGRQAIVKTFKEITSDHAHQYWGLST